MKKFFCALFVTLGFSAPTLAGDMPLHCAEWNGDSAGTLLVNRCNRHVYITWVDGNGEHVTAVARGGSVSIGNTAGRAQVTDVESQ
ncbi:MAG: hypothetical protein ABSE80_11255 [Halobacteriota archaeon]|jgi:hypothetical protein